MKTHSSVNRAVAFTLGAAGAASLTGCGAPEPADLSKSQVSTNEIRELAVDSNRDGSETLRIFDPATGKQLAEMKKVSETNKDGMETEQHSILSAASKQELATATSIDDGKTTKITVMVDGKVIGGADIRAANPGPLGNGWAKHVDMWDSNGNRAQTNHPFGYEPQRKVGKKPGGIAVHPLVAHSESGPVAVNLAPKSGKHEVKNHSDLPTIISVVTAGDILTG